MAITSIREAELARDGRRVLNTLVVQGAKPSSDLAEALKIDNARCKLAIRFLARRSYVTYQYGVWSASETGRALTLRGRAP